MSYQTDREDFLARLVHEFPNVAPHLVIETGRNILREAKRLQSLAEAECNGELTPRQQANDKGAQKRLAAFVAELPGLAIQSLSGDPRGYVVKLRLPSGRGNTWGGDECGWGVPA